MRIDDHAMVDRGVNFMDSVDDLRDLVGVMDKWIRWWFERSY